jgi:hypothetical protein
MKRQKKFSHVIPIQILFQYHSTNVYCPCPVHLLVTVITEDSICL